MVNDTPPKDPLDEFFEELGKTGDGGDTPPADEQKTGGAGDTVFNFPEEDWVPPPIRGKSAKEAAEIMKRNEAEFTKVNTAYAEATKMLDRVKAGTAASTPAGEALQDITVNALLEMRVDKMMGVNPELEPYRDEVMGLLANIADPRIRMTPDAMNLVLNQIRGNHHREILDAAVKKATAVAPPSVLEGQAFGGTPPRPSGVDLTKIDAQGKANLAGWFDGDLNLARENLLPAKE